MSDKGLEPFSILSVTNSVNMFLPMVGAFLRQSTIAGSMTSPVSKVISSELVSLKGFTTVPSFTRSHRAFKCLMNFFCSATDDSGCSKLSLGVEAEKQAHSNSSMALSTSGLESSMTLDSYCPYRPFAPLSSFRNWMLCYWLWSSAINEDFLSPRCMTNFRAINTSWTDGWVSGNRAMSLKKTGT